jgi:hypothetical protein
VALRAQPLTRNADLKRWFLVALLLSTGLPISFFILVAPSGTEGLGLTAIKTIFLFLGTAHVPATLLFYTDREFSGIIQSNRFLLVLGFMFWRVGELKEMEIVKQVSSYATAAGFLFGAVLGATASHFIVDADAWRQASQIREHS